MYIHREARVIYLAHPRTASVATATSLLHVGFCKLEPPSDHHSRLWDQGTPVTPENRSQWTVLTTIRNHWDAAVSWAFKRFKTRGGEPHLWGLAAYHCAFEANHWVQPDRMWWLHADEADVILRYETLEEDLGRALASCGVRMPTLIQHNVSRNRRGRSYREFFDDDSRGYIGDRFASEIERFGYAF